MSMGVRNQYGDLPKIREVNRSSRKEAFPGILQVLTTGLPASVCPWGAEPPGSSGAIGEGIFSGLAHGSASGSLSVPVNISYNLRVASNLESTGQAAFGV
jgi:hypothetical protein